MDLIYSFDSERFHLGRPCKHGHKWPGTELSLRRNFRQAPGCVGCDGAKDRDWLLRFIDYKQMGWPANQTLGRLCKRGHSWEGRSMTLQVNGRCQECQRITDRIKNARWRNRVKASPEMQQEQNAKARNRYLVKMQDAEWACRKREQSRLAAARSRALHGRPSRAKSGEFATSLECREMLALWAAIIKAGRCPSVAKLVKEAQRDYWKQCPDAYAQHLRDRSRDYAKWQCLTNHRYRVYHREKSKRRKAQARGQTPVAIPVNALLLRFSQFGNHCAYCGGGGDMQIEHVVPISKGGAHDIDNIVPACAACNSSKGAKDMEAWYQEQPFFSEIRQQKIKRVTMPPVAIQHSFS